MDKIQKLVKKELSGYKAWQHANYTTQFMRTPGSYGIHEITEYSRKKLNEYGLDNIYTIKLVVKPYGALGKLCLLSLNIIPFFSHRFSRQFLTNP